MNVQVVEQEASWWPTASVGTRKPRVLLAEDDPDMLQMVAWMLRNENYDVIEASDGVDLLRRIQAASWGERQYAFDAIVSDINMPDLTAVEVVAAISSKNPLPPFVLITAFRDPRARAEARALGAVAVLDKPLDWRKLRRAVRAAVGRQ